VLPLADIDLGDVLVALLVFYFLALALWLVIVLFADIFGRSDLSGGAKAGWTLLIFILPVIGIVAYLVARPAESPRGLSTAGGYQEPRPPGDSASR
jgi:hypothetical protein